MKAHFLLFLGTFTTLLAVINPLEALTVFLKLVGEMDEPARRRAARRSCLYAVALMVFFLLFGTLVLRAFGVPLNMVRIVGGIVLMKIGFSLFLPSPADPLVSKSGNGDGSDDGVSDIAFVPLAMPIMFGPGAMATVIGMSAAMKSQFLTGGLAAILLAILATMALTYLTLKYSQRVQGWIGPKGIDAVTRLVGFFVAAMGMGMIFHAAIAAIATDLRLPQAH
jgi:multiple antibiotic resistance protein